MYRRLVLGLVAFTAVGFLAGRAASLPVRELPAAGPESSAQPLPSRRRVNRDPVQRGVALGLFAEDVSFSYAPLLAEIAALGASHVALVVPLYQTHGASTQLRLHTRFSPTLEAIADAIRDARRAGLEVTLFPIVRLTDPRSPEEWRGTLKPSDPDAWFASYGQMVGDLASLATLTGATRLIIGSELSSLDGDLEHWSKLISFVRAVFSGSLVYSANWDHYQDARLFDLVDELGVTAYFGLRKLSAPSDVQTLTASWRRIGRNIESDLAKYNKPFVFTEVGYRSRAGATAAPWDESSGGTADLAEQQRGFEAFRLAWTEPLAARARLDGLYIWNWYGYGGPGTTSYTPRGKPAVMTIKQILADLEKP
ncbi:MAG TPA: hypothetical protein VF550_15770 [Polyangia bacterium]